MGISIARVVSVVVVALVRSLEDALRNLWDYKALNGLLKDQTP
jgi:hypothetical protein